MPTYKLTYFNARARAELARLLFTVADVKFEDDRVEMEDWPKRKPETPQGSMPVLEVDGTKICQSLAIARYLAREFKLYGKNYLEDAVIDQILDTCLDLFNPFMPLLFAPAEEQPKKIEEFYKATGEKVHGFVEKLISGTKGFAVGEKLSVADLYIFVVLESVVQPMAASLKNDKLLEKFPKIAAVKKTVENDAKVKPYLAKRPVTPF